MEIPLTLLEVLDPGAKVSFMSNYLEIGYDLSKVLFIATANSLLEVHPALRDRMKLLKSTVILLKKRFK